MVAKLQKAVEQVLSVDENQARQIKPKYFDLSMNKIALKTVMWGLNKILAFAHKLTRTMRVFLIISKYLFVLIAALKVQTTVKYSMGTVSFDPRDYLENKTSLI